MYCATLRTQAGAVVGLSITTSNLGPFRALMSSLRSPINCSTRPLKKSGRVLLRLISVTLWPRAIAYSTCSGPVNPVPPRIRMLSDAPARSVRRRAGSADTTGESLENGSRPSAPAATAEALRKVRRLVATSGSGVEVYRLLVDPQLGRRPRLPTVRG